MAPINVVLGRHRDLLFILMKSHRTAAVIDILTVLADEVDEADVIAWVPINTAIVYVSTGMLRVEAPEPSILTASERMSLFFNRTALARTRRTKANITSLRVLRHSKT